MEPRLHPRQDGPHGRLVHQRGARAPQDQEVGQALEQVRRCEKRWGLAGRDDFPSSRDKALDVIPVGNVLAGNFWTALDSGRS
jgi:hypothetical protein